MEQLPDAICAKLRVLLTCLESPLATVERALRRAKQFGLTTILNPAPACPEAGSGELLKLVDVLTPNEVEAAALAGLGNSGTSPLAAAQQLRQRGAAVVIVTCGADGCQIVAAETSHVPARRVKAVDTTAAGDAFNGALAVALAEGRSLTEAVRWASAAAAISVTRPGAIASLASRGEIQQACEAP